MKQIYLDSDDEITAIINKLEEAEAEQVALIPPKRSTALQSVVNLKLLKKASEAKDNQLVIITQDPAIINVASQLKILIAPNLEAEPSVPEPKKSRQKLPGTVIDGSLANDKDLKSAEKATKDIEPEDSKSKTPLSNKKSRKVPDFDRFKKYALLGILALAVLIGGLWWALFVAPTAAINIEGRTQNVSANVDFRLDPTAEESNIEAGVLAAELKQESRTFSTTFEPTGTQTVGERATGQVTVTNDCYDTTSNTTIAQGTAFRAANGRVFRNNVAFDIPPASVTGGACNSSNITVAVTADDIGSQYNISPSSYSIGNFPTGQGGINGQGGNMSGGSSEEVTVVSAGDINRARERLVEEERQGIEESLREQFGSDLFIIDASFSETVEETTSEPPVGEQSTMARLIIQVTYTLLAVDESDIEDLLEHSYREGVEGGEDMGMIQSGLDQASIASLETDLTFNIIASGVLGPDIEPGELKAEIAGISYREAIDIIESKPNVSRTQIDLSPFWVSSIPSNHDKINIEFEVDDTDAEDNSG